MSSVKAVAEGKFFIFRIGILSRKSLLKALKTCMLGTGVFGPVEALPVLDFVNNFCKSLSKQRTVILTFQHARNSSRIFLVILDS